jgi:hypothetical protein
VIGRYFEERGGRMVEKWGEMSGMKKWIIGMNFEIF